MTVQYYIPSWISRNECCCNCMHHLKLMSHPWVNGLPITQQVGWACQVATAMEEGILGQWAQLSREHGFCELYDRVADGPHCKKTQAEYDEAKREQHKEQAEAIKIKALVDSCCGDTGYETNLPDYGDLFTVEGFRQDCLKGAFSDYDGVGHPVLNNKMNPAIEIKPSRLDEIPKDATSIMWFNR